MSAAPRIADTTVGNLARRNPGPNADPVLMAARSLAIEVQASRKLIADLRALHRPMWVSEQAKAAGKEPWVCELCGTGDGSWPCESVLLIDEAGL